LWAAKGQPGVSGRKIVEVDTRQERIGLSPFGAADWDVEFLADPERVIVTDTSETVVEERTDPRLSFAGSGAHAEWDSLQTGYFLCYSLWNYLTAPFLLGYPGVEVHEIDPHQEGHETWRRLHVTFPASIATHSPEQVFYFDKSGMQRRLDYSLEIDGGIPMVEYTHDPKTVDGIVAPTRRQTLPRQEDGKGGNRAVSTIDIHHLEYHSG
jgi:hypothetical protein